MYADDEEDEKPWTPDANVDEEYDPSEKKYRGMGGPKDINEADWWKKGDAA